VLEQLSQYLPVEGLKILIVLFLSFLIGLEREEHKAESEHYSFGGVRTFPLIGLLGYVMALLSKNQLLPVAIGFAVVGGFLLVSYRHKLTSEKASDTPGITTEISGLGTYLLGALVYQGFYWIATTLAVISLLLLELKEVLEGLSERIAPREVLTFTKFLLLTAVALPVLPNAEFSRFRINPFKTWTMVVAVSAISYGSYLLLNLTRERSGVVLSSVLGGAYSSTATTVALAKKASGQQQSHLFSGGILIASGIMYLRLAVLLLLFSRRLLAVLAAPLLTLFCLAVLGGWMWSRLPDTASGQTTKRRFTPRNPLELRVAFLFAALFVGLLVLTDLVLTHLGRTGIYGLSGIVGLVDVDPFVLGMTQSAGGFTPVSVAAKSIVIAAASNNLAKGIYALGFSDRKTGIQSLLLLSGLSVLGLAPLEFLR
jgi:uncharacterized membrane protein (DUF4010 family)